ncbi:hypothetical protein N7533_011252 [Penicillium manginii]|uniref:uncharacterized protein n=1 Tax=Penicillium manginii TaxID=203109 RepID=UPI0025479D10|nr:uncharacterized protein N7533_011252 [Penicillium manginii]KAJ5741843.1 hypothetical protein N7533_011252 [Penicillium manginii]
MDIRYDDDDSRYYQKTLEILNGTPNDQRKEYRDTWGQTLLHYAARSGNRGIFAAGNGLFNSEWESLLREFKDPGAIRLSDEEGRSALSWAAETQNLVAIRMLLRPRRATGNFSKQRMPNIGRSLYHEGREIYANDLDNDGQMPLFHLLLRRNFGPQNHHRSSRNGDLSTTIRGDYLLPMKHLIWNPEIWGMKGDSPFSEEIGRSSQGPSWQSDYFDKDYLNGKGRDGRSLLSHAVGQGDFHFVRTLLKVEGIDVRLADDNGTTPLMHAIQRRDKRIVDLLNSCPLQDPLDLPHALIGPNDDSVVESLEWAFQTGVIDNKSSGEAVLQHALNLKHLPAVKESLKFGVSPRKTFKYRSDWFELIKDSATQPKYLIVAETEMQDKKEYSLDFPDDDRQTSHHRSL